jgi:hypothetical protein
VGDGVEKLREKAADAGEKSWLSSKLLLFYVLEFSFAVLVQMCG